MRSDQFVVPGLPILLPLGLILMVVSGLALRRRGLLSPLRASPQASPPQASPLLASPLRLGAAWFAGWYAVAILGATLLPLHISRGGETPLFRINPIPLYDVRVTDFVLNVVMTLPFAAVLHVVFGVRDRVRVLRLGLLLSASIEVTQAVLILTVHDNRWAEANDLISNTLGVYLGYLALQRLLRLDRVRRLVSRLDLAPQVRV